MSEKIKKFTCECCKYSTKKPSDWIKHVETPKHKNAGNKKEYICEECGHKSLNTWNLKLHNLTHHASKEERSKQKYYCKDCDVCFFSSLYMTKHMEGKKHLNYIKAVKELNKIEIMNKQKQIMESCDKIKKIGNLMIEYDKKNKVSFKLGDVIKQKNISEIVPDFINYDTAKNDIVSQFVLLLGNTTFVGPETTKLHDKYNIQEIDKRIEITQFLLSEIKDYKNIKKEADKLIG